MQGTLHHLYHITGQYLEHCSLRDLYMATLKSLSTIDHPDE